MKHEQDIGMFSETEVTPPSEKKCNFIRYSETALGRAETIQWAYRATSRLSLGPTRVHFDTMCFACALQTGVQDENSSSSTCTTLLSCHRIRLQEALCFFLALS